MYCCIDIGSTKLKLALYQNRDLQYHYSVDRDTTKATLAILKKHKDITHCILSSVRLPLRTLESYLEKKYFYIKLSADTPVPIRNDYGSPSTLGKDRLAAVIGAYMAKPHEGHLVIDAGTCMTLDYIDKDGIFVGGNISPGINLRLRAMHEFTHTLPLVECINPETDLAKDTVSAIQNGAILGTIMEIESFIERIRSKYSLINITLTGGAAFFLAEYLKTPIFVSPNLVLEGLNEILHYNVQKTVS